VPLPPAKLSDKHRLIAYMKLGGASREDIATSLGYEPTYVSAITESPLFKALMDQLRGDLKHKTIGHVVDRIVSEGPQSVQVLVELRDHAESEQVRMTSARDLLDRNPETAKVSREDRRLETRIVVDSRALARIAGVLSEDAGPTIDADDAVTLPVTPPPLPPGVVPLAEAVASLAAAEDGPELR
jgi:hypothetical protein